MSYKKKKVWAYVNLHTCVFIYKHVNKCLHTEIICYSIGPDDTLGMAIPAGGINAPVDTGGLGAVISPPLYNSDPSKPDSKLSNHQSGPTCQVKFKIRVYH